MLFAANATHADVAVDAAGSTPPAMLLAMAAQTRGMPVPVGGAARLAEAMVDGGAGRGRGRAHRRRGHPGGGARRPGGRGGLRRRRGGRGPAGGGRRRRAPVALARDLVGEEHLPGPWLAALRRHRWTSGYFRVDVDLSAPAPWADERVRESTVVHVSGDLDELAMSQAQVRRGLLPDLPQLILGQQDRADPSRVPPGAASLWVECHCPARPAGDAAGELAQDWAPGSPTGCSTGSRRTRRGCATWSWTPACSPRWTCRGSTPTWSAGDVGGGSARPDQLLVFRPVAGWSPYALPVGGLYMCGAASHPGGGVHGMCGRNAAPRCCATPHLRLPALRARRSSRAAR